MTDKRPSFFEARTIAVITGASRGIGRAIALEFSRRFENGLHLVLTGRSNEGLQETWSLIRSGSNYSPERTIVRIVIGDLGNQAGFPSLLDELFGDIAKFQHAVLVSNAASTGDVTKLIRDFSPSDSSEVQGNFFLNITAPFLMVARFLSSFPPCDANNPDAEGFTRRTVVQITSGAARGLASWSLYSTGKAARDILHKVVAAEEPGVRVLSYIPGPVDTAMWHYAHDHSASLSTSETMARNRKNMVTPEKAAGVLCEVLEEDKYESGMPVNISEFTKSVLTGKQPSS